VRWYDALDNVGARVLHRLGLASLSNYPVHEWEGLRITCRPINGLRRFPGFRYLGFYPARPYMFKATLEAIRGDLMAAEVKLDWVFEGRAYGSVRYYDVRPTRSLFFFFESPHLRDMGVARLDADVSVRWVPGSDQIVSGRLNLAKVRLGPPDLAGVWVLAIRVAITAGWLLYGAHLIREAIR
jgi:hypothetical protein